MLTLIILLSVAGSGVPQSTISPDVLASIFGTRPPPVTPSGVTVPGLEDFTVRTTDSTSTFTESGTGEPCKCVPYYLCDTDLNGIHIDNASITGYGTLDIRFGEEDCQESIERCCKNPKRPDEVPIPKPDASRLRGCGYRNPNGVDFAITGGSGAEAQFGEFPWVVALLDSRNGSYAGVGVLIHPQVVMTGAHVAYKYPPRTLQVRVGEWDTQTAKERLRHQERDVEEAYIHKDFKEKTLKNDIALLRLSSPVQLADHINVICMPAQDDDSSGNKGCVANGWGKDVFGLKGRYSVILKKVEVDMVSHRLCNSQLQRTRLGTNFKLHSSFVCAGGEEGKDTCQGDGGAPLACPIGNDRYKLTGLVAWGIGCGQKDVPAVYTHVAIFRNWVDDKMADWGFSTSGYEY